MNSAALEVKGLSIKFGDFTAVDNISFSVNRGEIFGFLGANGAGKTTTIRMLCGLLSPTSGSALVGGLGFEDGGWGIKKIVGYMSQKFTLYNDLTVGENLDFAAGLRKLDPAYAKKRREELFGLIGFEKPLSSKVSASRSWRWPRPCCTIRRSSFSTSPPRGWRRLPAPGSGR